MEKWVNRELLKKSRAIALSNQKSPQTQHCITQDLLYLKELIEAGKIRAVIDRTYPLQELAAAHGDSETGRAVGKITSAQPCDRSKRRINKAPIVPDGFLSLEVERFYDEASQYAIAAIILA
ncbi:zinc-binding dehydrogenase [Nostoc flagelliforme FACHB-838]|uniref:Zinc-binding dehydrogenase n=1 Tax=Nostoc flagelliforme FACHB-838 TaxID=2692904 RepID=A0ABR8DGB5_9NOSO|nr:zinc-binding dehydrogenase [Nostoc flagelliforme FACHB-838]